MAQQYYGLLTNIGLAKLAAAASGGPTLALASMAFGDGNGVETAPAKTATALVNERYRAPVVEKYPHPTNPSILYVEGIIPSGIGGWTMREAGIYDAAGDLIVIAKPPAMNVALISEGASTEGIVRLPIVFDNLGAVELLIDPTVVLATQGWVLDRLLSRPFLTVNSVTTAAPPAAPAAHSLFVVPAAATGPWATQVGKLAWYHGGWIYRDAPVSLVVGASDTSKYWRRTADGWAEFSGSATSPGLVQFATAAEVLAAVVDGKAVAPKTLAPAVQSGKWNYAVTGGTANALTVTLDPDPASNAATVGMPLRIVTGQENTTSGPTLSVNGLPALPMQDHLGQSVPAFYLKPGIYEMIGTGTAWRVISTISRYTRIVLQADTTVYVNGATGNDSNDGRTTGTALKTIQAALDRIAYGWDLNGYIASVQVADGAYTAGGSMSSAPPGMRATDSIRVVGNLANPGAVYINAINDSCFRSSSGASFRVRGVGLAASGTSGTAGCGLYAGSGGRLLFDTVSFAYCERAHIYGESSGLLYATGGYAIAAGAPAHILLAFGAGATISGLGVTITNSPVFSNAYIYATNLAWANLGGAGYIGAATGPRFNVNGNALVSTNGAGPNGLPGSVAGAENSGGKYL